MLRTDTLVSTYIIAAIVAGCGFVSCGQLNVINAHSLHEPSAIVVNTWGFIDATRQAWSTLQQTGSSLSAVVDGCSHCELQQCDGSVGYGSHPDEEGEVTLDAMVMDGPTHGVGSVANLRGIKEAVRVAHSVMLHTTHTMLTGQQATDFGAEMGFELTNLRTNQSDERWLEWKNNDCQPNYRQNVTPDPKQSCGPYTPLSHPQHLTYKTAYQQQSLYHDIRDSHDTIGMVAVDYDGNVAAATSTNGANHKVPGRVGDSPIPGSGSYVDNAVGAAAATGDGDVMMRFLPSFLTVELMRNGASPSDAARESIKRISDVYPDFSGAIVAINIQNQYGAACHNVGSGFPYSVQMTGMPDAEIKTENCTYSQLG